MFTADQRSRTAPFIALACALLACTSPLVAAPPAVSPDQLPDATLHDICFVDPDRGFAVGERGAIWRTEDGGRHWRLTPSPLACCWQSIQFVDEQNGWIVGGYPHQLTHRSTGAILRTKDGGRTWAEVPKLVVPALKKVHFFDAKHGLAIGDASEFCPSGIFRTNNSGQTWMPAAGAAHSGWSDGAFHDPQRGVVVGPQGHVAVAGGGSLAAARLPRIGARHVRQVSLDASGGGWLVGDGGLVLRTYDGGIEWRMPRGRIPDIAFDQIDFRAHAAKGSHVWVAGSPGTVVLHSGDAGETWQLLRTEQHAPLRAIFFLDEHRGWAAGDLGTILGTRDGGRTWTVQQRGAAQAALLALYSLPERLPLEALTKLAGSEGYITATEILNTSTATPISRRVSIEERTAAATSLIGGSACDTTWRYPVPDDELLLSADGIIEHWNALCNGHGVESLEASVVRKIRQWRPEVILTERSSARGDDMLAHITNQIVLSAVSKAADAEAYPEQIRELALAPWKVKKVFSALPPETPGMVNLSTAQVAPRLGASLADVTSVARGLLGEQYRPGPTQLGFQLLMSTQPRDLAVRDFFSGINLPAGGDARRRQNEASPQSLEALRRQAQRARNIQQLMARSAADQASGGSWLGQVDDLTKGLSRDTAAQTLYELAWRYHYSGQWHAAADAYQLVTERYPDHDLADPAALWLVQYYASGEAAVRMRGGTRVMSGDGGFGERPTVSFASASEPSEASGATPSLNVRAHYASGSFGLNTQDRWHRAIDLAGKFQQSRPRLHATPELRFPLASAHREVGLHQQAQALLASFEKDRAGDDWWASAAVEAWLSRPTPQGPKPAATCKRIAEKPKLDGVLDDPFWASAKPIDLAHAGLPSATLQLAQDGEFLYLGVSNEKLAGFDYSLTSETRTHDADLTLHDRIDVCLDIDRDFATFYRFSFDYRGFTREACLGDASWNPTWYVAAGQEAGRWTIEAAIPLNEICLKPPQLGDAWALGAMRIMPGSGITGWNSSSSVKPRGEKLGVLLFE